MTMARRLSEKSMKVLSLIAEGRSYSQIVNGHSHISYRDIFDAAEEALRLNDAPFAYEERMAAIKQKYPRAYERWTEDEDAQLMAMHTQLVPLEELVERFQRQPSAIRSRLEKLGLRLDQVPS